MRWRYLFAVLASTSASLLAPSSTPRCSNGIYMKQATASKKGFAMKPKAVKIKKRAVVPLDPSVKAALDELETLGPASLRTHLNPALFEDPQTMADIGKRLQNGEVVILRDAFRPEFAEMVYQELAAKDVPWSLNEAYFNDGYHHHHHNVYDKGLWSQRLNSTFDVFRHQDSMSLMAELSGRDCSGETTGAPSWYQSGDHSCRTPIGSGSAPSRTCGTSARIGSPSGAAPCTGRSITTRSRHIRRRSTHCASSP